jgi:hypothetical protein
MEYFSAQAKKWKDILNSDYKTDSGIGLELHSRGRFEAAVEALTFLKKLEERHEK